MLQVIGKQCAASTHPCLYCEAKIPLLLKSKLNTLSSLLAHHNKWIEEGSKLGDLKKHNNVIHPPILTCNPDQPLHEALNIPGLHILLGITDKILTACEKNLYDSLAEGFDRMTAFLALLNIKRVCYQGSHRLEGNACNKLLKNVDKLERFFLEEGKGLQAAKYIQAFRCFDSLVNSCFGKTLSADYKDRIGQFSKDYRDLNIGISVKFHILEAHVEDFIIFIIF